MSALFSQSAKPQKIIARFEIYDNKHIPIFREQVRALLDDNSESDGGLLYVGFNEAFNNALYHSCALESSEDTIRVKLNIKANNSIIIRIKHQGHDFPGNQLLTCVKELGKDPFAMMLDRESGRGLLLVNAIFDKVYYSKNGKEIMMIKRMRGNLDKFG